jgi:hypothetical protein
VDGVVGLGQSRKAYHEFFLREFFFFLRYGVCVEGGGGNIYRGWMAGVEMESFSADGTLESYHTYYFVL